MKKVIWGSFLSLAGIIATALLLGFSMIKDWINDDTYSVIFNLSRYELLPVLAVFIFVAILGMVISLWGIFEKWIVAQLRERKRVFIITIKDWIRHKKNRWRVSINKNRYSCWLITSMSAFLLWTHCRLSVMYYNWNLIICFIRIMENTDIKANMYLATSISCVPCKKKVRKPASELTVFSMADGIIFGLR